MLGRATGVADMHDRLLSRLGGRERAVLRAGLTYTSDRRKACSGGLSGQRSTYAHAPAIGTVAPTFGWVRVGATSTRSCAWSEAKPIRTADLSIAGGGVTSRRASNPSGSRVYT